MVVALKNRINKRIEEINTTGTLLIKKEEKIFDVQPTDIAMLQNKEYSITMFQLEREKASSHSQILIYPNFGESSFFFLNYV